MTEPRAHGPGSGEYRQRKSDESDPSHSPQYAKSRRKWIVNERQSLFTESKTIAEMSLAFFFAHAIFELS